MELSTFIKKAAYGCLFFALFTMSCQVPQNSDWVAVDFFESGDIKQEVLGIGTLDSTMMVREYYEGYIIRAQYEYVEGKMHGKSFGFYADGSIAEVKNFENGELSGFLMRFTEDGKQRAKFMYEDSKMVDGSMFYDNGQPTAELSFDSLGNVSGGVYFHENGNLRSKGNVLNGTTKVGHWDYFYKNGVLKETGEYIDGKKRGNWEMYDSLGNQTMVVPYH
jgi:antitoxin component YwqK of YwqJK toxin-antitoxin module